MIATTIAAIIMVIGGTAAGLVITWLILPHYTIQEDDDVRQGEGNGAAAGRGRVSRKGDE